MTGWQDIATAPRDCTPLLLYVQMPDNDPYVQAVCEGQGWSVIECGYYEEPFVNALGEQRGGWQHETAGTPTHWQPLPEPPHRKPLSENRQDVSSSKDGML